MRQSFIFVLVFLWALPASPCSADELPLWEAGTGFTSLSIPDYQGSNERHGYLFPLPYVIYRGDILRSDDRKGMYGLLYHSQHAEFNISFDLGVPVKSDRNAARTGMPDLDAMIQIGPSLEICLVQDCDADRAVQLRFPVRAAVAFDFSHFMGIGFVVNPNFNFDFRNIGPGGRWNFGFALGPLFATERYNDYYYQVSPQYAIPGVRPAYDARSGYSGTMLVLSLSKRFEHVWFGAFARYEELAGAVFENSPLVKTNHSLTAGFGFAWVLGQSKTLVNAHP